MLALWLLQVCGNSAGQGLPCPNRGHDKPDYEEWQFEDLIKAMEARGFLRMDVTNGPAWDRNGA